MSGKPRKSSSAKRIDRPLAAEVLRRAREIAASYQIVLWFEDGEYFGRAVELPNVMNDGGTPDVCVRNVRDILTTTIAYLLEEGQVPPPPASENKRTEQLNVRLTASEKLMIEEAARAKGYRGASDFVRASTLGNLR